MEVFVLAGQSNMAGRGGVQRRDGAKYFEAPESGPDQDERVHRFSGAGCWELAEEPLHKDIDTRFAHLILRLKHQTTNCSLYYNRLIMFTLCSMFTLFCCAGRCQASDQAYFLHSSFWGRAVQPVWDWCLVLLEKPPFLCGKRAVRTGPTLSTGLEQHWQQLQVPAWQACCGANLTSSDCHGLETTCLDFAYHAFMVLNT